VDQVCDHPWLRLPAPAAHERGVAGFKKKLVRDGRRPGHLRDARPRAAEVGIAFRRESGTKDGAEVVIVTLGTASILQALRPLIAVPLVVVVKRELVAGRRV